MTSRATNGYVIEGVSGVGKSRLLGALQAELVRRRPGCTKLVLSEHYTERVFEDARARGEADFDDVLAHTRRLVEQIDALFGIKARSKFDGRRGNAGICVLVERFLGSHAAHLWRSERLDLTSVEPAAIQRQYARLAEHGVVPLVLHIAPESLAEAISETRRLRNEAWSAHLDSLGDGAQIRAHFQCWQEHLLRFYADHIDVPILYRRIENPAVCDYARMAAELVDEMNP